MLVLSRKQNESIIINGDTRVTVVSIRGNQVRLGVEAPTSVPVFREELCEPFATTATNVRHASAGVTGRQATLGTGRAVRHGAAPPSANR